MVIHLPSEHVNIRDARRVSNRLAEHIIKTRDCARSLYRALVDCDFQTGVLLAIQFEEDIETLADMDKQLAEDPTVTGYDSIRHDVLREIHGLDGFRFTAAQLPKGCVCERTRGQNLITKY